MLLRYNQILSSGYSSNKNITDKNLRVEKIIIKNLQHFISNQLIIPKVDIEVSKGEILHIKGNNGSGKSTLVNVILGLIKPTNGTIIFKDIYDREISGEILNDCIVAIPQEPQLFSTDVRSNILLDNINEFTDEDIIVEAKLLGINGISKKFLDVKVLNKGINLSAGQRQKLSILRSMLVRKDILIIDEFETNLDSKTKENFMQYIYVNRHKYITIIVSHYNIKSDKQLILHKD